MLNLRIGRLFEVCLSHPFQYLKYGVDLDFGIKAGLAVYNPPEEDRISRSGKDERSAWLDLDVDLFILNIYIAVGWLMLED